MRKALIILILIPFFVPEGAFPLDINKTTYRLLHKWIPWREKVKIIDEISRLESQKVLDTLIIIYRDGSLNFACPSILYHTVNGLRYFQGNQEAVEIVREAIHNREPEVRMISLEVLGIIGSEDDIDYLKPFLAGKSYFEASYAQNAIDRIKTRTGLTEK